MIDEFVALSAAAAEEFVSVDKQMGTPGAEPEAPAAERTSRRLLAVTRKS